jgi:predicted Zn-dependent protease
MRARFASLTAAAVLLAQLGGCASNPATGGADMVLMSQGREIAIGREMHEKMVAEGAVYDDPELQAYIGRVGRRLAANSDKPDLTFTFTVVDNPDINAFATPGGYIYVNRGLLAFLDSEAELAGVLAHEIGHVTARHHGRRQTADITNKVLATSAYILTGSGDLADASSMYGAELISGYGRDLELEADGLGAKYMHQSGYDTDALLEVIGVLKDQEQHQRVQARATGKAVKSYHGLYASHPRNDQRLQTVVRAAGELAQAQMAENPEQPGEFRRRMEGLVWGASVQGEREENRYYHNKLGFSFEHPPRWGVTTGARAIVATAPDSSASLTLTIRRRDRNASPQSVLEGSASGALQGGTGLDQAGLQGYTAVARGGGRARRLGVIDYNSLSYLFEGQAADFAGADDVLLGIIQSFRPMAPGERRTGAPLFLHYIQVPRGATLASLAASMAVPDAEAQLRLLNGFYPRGEPRTGDWIKVIRRGAQP